MVSSMKSTFISLPLFIVAVHQSGIRKAIFWSVTIYNKLSSQDILIAQIESSVCVMFFKPFVIFCSLQHTSLNVCRMVIYCTYFPQAYIK